MKNSTRTLFISILSAIMAFPAFGESAKLKFQLPTIFDKAETLYVGYFDDLRSYKLLQQLSDLPYKKIVIASEEYVPQITTFIKATKLHNTSVLSLKGDQSTPWSRDYMLFAQNLQTKKMTLWDMPYGRSGDDIPKLLEQQKVAPRFEPKAYQAHHSNEISSAEYGGNILALPYNAAVIGSNMSTIGKEALRQHLSSNIFEIDVGWLETGHVDEIVSILPTPGKNCGSFVLLEASPSLAIMLAWLAKPTDNNDLFFRCFSKKITSKKVKSFCNLFFALNLEYQAVISAQITKIDQELRRISGCRQLQWERLPVLFAPAVLRDEGNKEEMATSVNPNPINLLSLGNIAVIPHQDFKPYSEEVTRILNKYQIKPIFVEAGHLNEYYGGIHCNINVKRKIKR